MRARSALRSEKMGAHIAVILAGVTMKLAHPVTGEATGVNGAGCVTHLRSSSSVSAEHRFSSTPNFRPLFIVYVVVLLPSEGHGDDGECVDE